MSSVADIWNQALGLVGVDGEIQDPDADADAPATACRRFWVTVRDQVLRDFPWPKLKTTEDLALVEADPNDGIEWAFSYAQPANCLAIRRLLNGSTRIDNEATVVPYDVGRKASDGSVIIFTDLEDAQIEYTFHETDTSRYDADVVMAMALLLAASIAARFGPEAVKLGDRALRLYEWRRGTAQANAMNEKQPDLPTGSSFERAR